MYENDALTSDVSSVPPNLQKIIFKDHEKILLI